jgi:hypothetical protein
MTGKKFECIECGKQVKGSENNPECCGKPMKQLPLDICVKPTDAEQARLMEDNEPCDDGRAG